MLPHALLPQIPQGSIPVIVKALGNLLKMMGFHRLDILAPLLQSELGLRCAVRMVKDMHQLPENTAEAVYKPLILAFQLCDGLFVLHRYMAGFLEEAPT